MQDIADLPPELGYNIFKYCTKPDLMNFACCSQSHYDSVKYLIHKAVRIPWTILEKQSLNHRQMENLKFVMKLHFAFGGLSRLFNNIIWDSIEAGYEKVIEHTDPDILMKLEFEGIILNGQNSMTVLIPYPVQEISFSKCLGISARGWKYLSGLRGLRKLSITQSTLVDIGLSSLASSDTLEELYLTRCGEITDEGIGHLSNLRTLQKLHIMECKKISPDGYLLIGECRNLKEFQLYDVTLTDTSLTSLRQLRNLKTLKLKYSSGNPFGVIEESLSYLNDLTCLETLSLNSMDLGGNGSNLFINFNCLTELDISGCGNVTKPTFCNIFKLSSLLHLNMSNCTNLTDDHLIEIIALNSLKSLDLTNCILLTDKGLSYISELSPSLHELHLQHCCEMTDTGLDSISRLERLRHLNIGGCYQLTDAGLYRLSSTSQLLTNLKLTGCTQVTQVGLSYLKSFPNLLDLDISLDLFNGRGECMKTSDEGMVEVSIINSLIKLNLSCCDYITNSALEHVGKLNNLEILNVSCCIKISDEGVKYVTSLVYLTDLDISMCLLVTDDGIDDVCKMTSIKRVDIHGCDKVSRDLPNVYPFLTFRYSGFLTKNGN